MNNSNQHSEYRGESEIEKKEFAFVLETIEEEKKISKLPVNTQDIKQNQAILLPYYLKANGSFQVGDNIYLTLGEHEYEFLVMGFVEDPLFATPLNISVYKCYIMKAYLEEIEGEEPSLKESKYKTYKVRLKEGERSIEFDDKISTLLTKEVPDLSNSINMGMNWESMKGGDAILSKVAMGIMLVFSGLLVIISLIIVRFSVRGFIEDNMKNIGVLQACGYTVRQLRCSIFMEMFGITAIASTIGLTAGISGSGLIRNAQASMIGLSWNQTFDLKAAVVTMTLVLVLISTVTLSATKIYKRISILDALRGGIHNHNFRRNYLPLDKCMFSKSVALGCKSILGEKMKNIAILFIIMLLSFTCCAGFFLYENFAKDTSKLLKLTGIELGTAIITGGNLEQIKEKAETFKSIDQILCYENCSVKLMYKDSQVTITCDMWSDPKSLINETIVEGRLPEYENEIVVTTNVSEKLVAEVGDVIYVEGLGEKKSYIITGIDQKINNMGLKALMTLEGQARLNGINQVSSLYVYAKEGYSFEEIQTEITKQFTGINIFESVKQAEDSLNGISRGMELICAIFVTITVLVVTMVVMLLIKSKLMKERKNYGIYKALGFTSGELMRQTIMTNFPVDLIGAVAGAILAGYFTNSLVALCLSFLESENVIWTLAWDGFFWLL